MLHQIFFDIFYLFDFLFALINETVGILSILLHRIFKYIFLSNNFDLSVIKFSPQLVNEIIDETKIVSKTVFRPLVHKDCL